MSIIPNKDHIGSNINWELEPNCSCGQLKKSIDNKFIFVSNMTLDSSNLCYLIPLTESGEPFNPDGVQISHCPWCGDKISLKKKIS